MMWAVMLLVSLISAPAAAKSLDKSMIPAEAKWVVHFDMDMFGKTALKQLVWDNSNALDIKHIETDLKDEINIDLFKDVRSITAYANKNSERNMVAIVSGNLDKDYLLRKLKRHSKYKEEKYGKYTVYKWKHDSHGVFVGNSMLLFSRDEDSIKNALDVIDGKKTSIASGSLVSYLKMIPANAFLLAVADDVSALNKATAQAGVILDKSGMASFMALEKNKNLTMKVMFNTTDEKTALQVENVIRGLMAFAQMQKNKDGKTHDWVKLVEALQVLRRGNSLELIFSYPSEEIVRFLESQHKHKMHKHEHKHELEQNEHEEKN